MKYIFQYFVVVERHNNLTGIKLASTNDELSDDPIFLRHLLIYIIILFFFVVDAEQYFEVLTEFKFIVATSMCI